MFSKTTKFENLLEAVPDSLVGMDQKGMIRYVNRQTESLFGYDRDELIGHPVETLVPEPAWQIYASHREEYFADPMTRSRGLDLELSGRRRNGTQFPVIVSFSRIDTGDVLLVITALRAAATQRRAVRHAELLAALVEYSDDAIIGCTLEGVVTSWNPAAERMYGYWSHEIVGKSVNVLVPVDRVGESYANLARVRGGEVVERLETVRVRKKGTLFPVSLTIAPILDQNGEIVGASAVHRDVTEQRRAFELAQRMEAIVASSGDAIIGRTLEGIITSWNPAAERMYGYSSEEIVGKSIDCLIPDDRMAEIRAVLVRVKEGEHVDCLETIRVRKDGTVFPVSVTLSPIRDAEGMIVGASAIDRDVTEQRRAFEVAQRMEAVVASSYDAIIGGTLEGIVTSWNPAAERMYVYSSQEIIGQHINRLIPEDRTSQVDDALVMIMTGEKAVRLETTFLRKDGTGVPVSASISPIRDESGNVIGASSVHRDVTEDRRAFEVAQRMKALVESSDDAIIGLTLEGIVTSWNPAAERMYGYSNNEAIGRSIRLVVPEDRRGEVEANLDRIRAGQHVEQYQTVRVRKDGTLLPISLTVSPIHDSDGVVVGASGIGRDLTEQELAAHYARSLLEADLDALVTISPEGRIKDVNEAAVMITGCSRETLIGSDYSQYVTEPDRARWYFRQAFEQGMVTNFPMTVRHTDGTETDVLCNASVYRDIKGDVLGVLATGRATADLTNKRRSSGA